MKKEHLMARQPKTQLKNSLALLLLGFVMLFLLPKLLENKQT